MLKNQFPLNIVHAQYNTFRVHLLPINSAGLFCRWLIKVSKLSFRALTNFSFLDRHTSITLSILSLKSSKFWTMSLSFSASLSGFITMVLPVTWGQKKKIINLILLLYWHLGSFLFEIICCITKHCLSVHWRLENSWDMLNNYGLYHLM